MMISILGCGWYGRALASALLQKGVVVKGSTTSAGSLAQLEAIAVHPYLIKFGSDSEIIDPDFFQSDVLIISIPPKFKAGGGEGYPDKIRRIIAACLEYQVKKVIYISSTAVYGEHNAEVNELDEPKPDTISGAILLEAEKLFRNETSFKTTIIRFGGLIGPGRHPGRFFAAKVGIPNGLAPVNLVHLSDCVAICTAIIVKNAFGYLFNACLPDHPPKGDFYREMSLDTHLQVPVFIHELKNWKIVNSINLTRILSYNFIIDQLQGQHFDL